MFIPEGPQALTSDWLTQALRQNGIIIRAAVTAFQIQSIGAEGEGITGQTARVKLVYDRDEQTAPHTLIAKFHAADLAVRAAVNSYRGYENELRFYQKVATQVATPTPRYYYGDFHDSGVTVLLLEDLAPARSVGWDMNPSQIELAIRQIAQLHAFWWEHPQSHEILGQEDLTVIKGVWNHIQSQAQHNWGSFLELTMGNLPQDMMEIGQRIVDHWAAIGDQLYYHAPRTFIHGDFGPDNFFFATAEGGAPFTLIDWQLFKRGRGVYDIGMLLGGLPTEQRRKTEGALLQLYYQILVENNVAGYTLEQCFDDYRLTQLDAFARLVFVMHAPLPGENLERYRATDHKFREVELPRRCAAIVDLGAEKLIPA